MESNSKNRNLAAIILGALGLAAIIAGASTTVQICTDGCSTSANSGLIWLGAALATGAIAAKFSHGRKPGSIGLGAKWLLWILSIISAAAFFYQSVNGWVIIIMLMSGGFIVIPLLLIAGLTAGIVLTVKSRKKYPKG